MTIGLHNLQRYPGSVRRRKRVGRGLGSGHGTMSTRGTKGQRARSGGSKGIGRRSMRNLVMHVPKFKGMRGFIPKRACVLTDQLERHCAAGQTVDGGVLAAAGLVGTSRHGVKILAGARPMTKAVTVKAEAFSAGAKKIIEAAGGKAVIVEPRSTNYASRKNK